MTPEREKLIRDTWANFEGRSSRLTFQKTGRIYLIPLRPLSPVLASMDAEATSPTEPPLEFRLLHNDLVSLNIRQTVIDCEGVIVFSVRSALRLFDHLPIPERSRP